MGKTLYLTDNNRSLRVICDGPSILVKETGTADRRLPIRLLDKVLIIGNVMLDAGVITLFAEHNVPVIFMSRRSEESAVALPYNHRLSRHYEAQKLFLSSKESINRYTHWANTKRMTIQLRVLKRLFKNRAPKFNREIGEGNYQLVLKGLKPADENLWLVVSETVNTLLRGLIIDYLLRAEIDPHTGIIHRRHNFGMALDICYIMGAESDIQSIQFLRCVKSAPYIVRKYEGIEITSSGMHNIVQRFENRKEALKDLIEDIIDELFELMRELRI